IKVFSGVPSGISTRPVLAILPTSENTLVPALLALPVSVNQAGPLATMGAMLYQVSTLLMLVVQPHMHFCAANGGAGGAGGGGGGGGGPGRTARPWGEGLWSVPPQKKTGPPPPPRLISKLKPR